MAWEGTAASVIQPPGPLPQFLLLGSGTIGGPGCLTARGAGRRLGQVSTRPGPSRLRPTRASLMPHRSIHTCLSALISLLGSLGSVSCPSSCCSLSRDPFPAPIRPLTFSQVITLSVGSGHSTWKGPGAGPGRACCRNCEGAWVARAECRREGQGEVEAGGAGPRESRAAWGFYPRGKWELWTGVGTGEQHLVPVPCGFGGEESLGGRGREMLGAGPGGGRGET